MATNSELFPESSLDIVAPDGGSLPPHDKSMVLALDLVRAQQIHLARLQNKLSARQHRIVRVALDEMAARLTHLAATGRDKWNQARMARTMLMLARGLVQLVGDQKSALTADLAIVARQSQLDAAKFLATLDRHFTGSIQPLHFDSLAWWDETHKNIGRVRIRNYTNSWLRYGSTVTRKIEDALSATAIMGEPWYTARDKVMDATRDALNGSRPWVDRILRTESSAHWNGVQLAALQSEDDPDDPMLKKLITHFDDVTGRDSVLLHGQTRPVDKPFYDSVNRITYMAPPNRPHDREVLVGWRDSYGEDFEDFDKETATGYDQQEHGKTPRDLDQEGQAEDPTGWMRPARVRSSYKRYPTEPTPTERKSQLETLRWKRDYIAQQLGDARAQTAHLKRQADQQGGEMAPILREQYRVQAELAVSLTRQHEEHRQWIDMLTAGTHLPPAATP